MKKVFFLCLFLLSFSARVSCQAPSLTVVIHYDLETASETYIQGDPVLIYFVASNLTAMNAYNYNTAMGKELEKIPAVSIGSASVPWINAVVFKVTGSDNKEVPVKITAQAPKENKVTLDGTTAIKDVFFISPEESNRLKPGTYQISASLNGTRAEAIILKISAAGEKALNTQEEMRHLLAWGRFYLVKGEYEKAEKSARDMLNRDRHSLRALNLLGDALTGEKKFREAYDTFMTAAQEFYRQYPQAKNPKKDLFPEMFLEKMNKLQDRAF